MHIRIHVYVCRLVCICGVISIRRRGKDDGNGRVKVRKEKQLKDIVF